MNGKQAKLLKGLMADKKDVAHWRGLSKEDKGRLRIGYRDEMKAGRFSYGLAVGLYL